MYKQLKIVAGDSDLKAMMAQLADVFSQLEQLSQEALDQVENLKKATQGAEMPWK